MDGAHHVNGTLPGTEFDVAIDSFGAEWPRTSPVRQAIRHAAATATAVERGGRPQDQRLAGLEMDVSVRNCFVFEF